MAVAQVSVVSSLFTLLQGHSGCGSGSRSEQLAQQLRAAILAGALKPGEKLPSTRALAQQLSIARNTLLATYDMLIAEGLLESRRGAGTFVSQAFVNQTLVNPVVSRLSAQQTDPLPGSARHATPVLSALAQRLTHLPLWRSAGRRLLPAQPALDIFPHRQWQTCLKQASARQHYLHGSDLMGCPDLRRAIATLLQHSRGVRIRTEQVMITHGSQQALSLLIQLLADTARPVLLEDYGFPGVDQLLHVYAITPTIVPTDQAGIQVEHLPDTAALLIVTPSRSFPLGHTLSLPRRLALLEWARQTGSWIIEDDYDSELLPKGQPIVALQGLDQTEQVIYTGTFSRTLFPGVRLGYLLLPAVLCAPLRHLRLLFDGGSNHLLAATVANFIDSGAYGRHVRRLRQACEQRRACLDQAIQEHLPNWQLLSSRGSMHQLYRPADNASVAMLSTLANRAGFGLRNVASYARVPCQQGGLLVGFADTTPAQMDQTVRQLADCFSHAG